MLFNTTTSVNRFSIRIYMLSAFLMLVNSIVTSQTPCDCTNCPQFMPDNFVGSFLINIQNAANPTLGQNGQGVCGVNINFEHEYLGDLRITLTSPSGQQVTLVGPIGLFGATDGTTWNVNFVPCGSSVDPDPGFSANWNNNQPWGLGGSYGGSYYPSAGCLQSFSGPVNGTWSLTVIHLVLIVFLVLPMPATCCNPMSWHVRERVRLISIYRQHGTPLPRNHPLESTLIPMLYQGQVALS
jgi:hypothetical protein